MTARANWPEIGSQRGTQMTFKEWVEYANEVLADNPHTADWSMPEMDPSIVFHPYSQTVDILT